jgi:hypothetical protein
MLTSLTKSESLLGQAVAEAFGLGMPVAGAVVVVADRVDGARLALGGGVGVAGVIEASAVPVSQAAAV